MVRGVQEKEVIDYSDTFASMVKHMGYKPIFALSSAKYWKIYQINVKTVFSYRLIESEVYINQPHGFKNGTCRVCRPLQPLYGLR